MKHLNIPSLSIIGLLSLTIIFGWFRYGYGLLFTEFRSSFELSASLLGVISSLTFITFLAGAFIVILFVSKAGARPMILGGILTVSAGLLIASLTGSWLLFAAACLLAGFSPGLTWSSFSKSVSQNVPPHLQERSLAVISTGSTVGLMFLATIYLVLDGNWRLIWGGGAAAGLLIFFWAYKKVPTQGSQDSGVRIRMDDLKPIFTKVSVPFYAASLLFGLTESTYWTYAADFVQENFQVTNANAVFFLITGVAGLAGLGAGDLISKMGMRLTFFLTILAYSISIALLYFSGNWWVVCFSAVLFGSSFMLYAAYLPIWSAEVFPNMPAQGFSICIVILNVGAIIGPAVFGWMLAYTAYKLIFLTLGGIALLKVFLLPYRNREA